MPNAAHDVAREAVEDQERLLIDQAIAKHGNQPGALLGILEGVQSANAHKFLSMESLRYIAHETGIPPARVYSTATFYALFNLEPQGDNVSGFAAEQLAIHAARATCWTSSVSISA